MKLAVIAVAAAIALTGCLDGSDDTEETWWAMNGIQCKATPWDAWAEETGFKPTSQPATEPFQRDARVEETMTAYYASVGLEVDAVAYFDDRVYPAVCDANNGRHYWIHSAIPPAGQGWTERAEGPPDL